MSNEMPRVGDKVRVSTVREGVVQKVGSYAVEIKQPNGFYHWFNPDGAEVEILERADNPANDLVGSVRRDYWSNVYVKTGVGPLVEVGLEWTRLCDGHRIGSATISQGGSVIGTVPGTPAAEAEGRPKTIEVGDTIGGYNGEGIFRYGVVKDVDYEDCGEEYLLESGNLVTHQSARLVCKKAAK